MNGSEQAPSTVPVVDFSAFVHEPGSQNADAAAQRATASSIDRAFRSVGFVCLTKHGVSAESIAKCFQWSARFFDLPLDKKMLAPHPPGGSHHRGYSAVARERAGTMDVVSDVKESFESGNVADMNQPNIWPPPDVIPGFQSSMENYFNEGAALIHRVLRALAIALDLEDPERLSRTHDGELFQLRLLHYPPVSRAEVDSASSKGKRRIGAHSDFGTLTLLWQDAVGGLEVQNRRDESWIPVQPVEGGVLVNVGDLMERWSNGRWLSAVHRVVAPPSEAGEVGEVMCPPRYSIPLFATADDDTLIDALPGCWGPDVPKKYDAVTAREYVQLRMAELY